MNGESIQFFIFLAILFVGGTLIILIRALIFSRGVSKGSQGEISKKSPSAQSAYTPPVSALDASMSPEDHAASNLAAPAPHTLDFPSMLAEVMEQIPRPPEETQTFGTQGAIIETYNLRKTFISKVRGKTTTVEAVRGITFNVQRGEIFGLLGPNGAGKTTTMRMLATLISPTSGSAMIVGSDLATAATTIRTKIGYVSQVGGMQREVSGRGNLLLQAKLYGMSDYEAYTRVNELIASLGLQTYADRRTSTYSGGQRRMFDLASGIVHKPELLFLDEPSTGLDPQNRAQVWEQVKKLAAAGTTIFVTTHYLEEADALCDRVAIVDKGTIVALDTPDALKRQIAGDIVNLGFEMPSALAYARDLLTTFPYITEIQERAAMLSLYVNSGNENLPLIMKVLHDHGIAIASVALSRPTLDDVFLKLTGHSLGEAV